MKYCPHCGASIIERAAFCMECGKQIPAGLVPEPKSAVVPEPERTSVSGTESLGERPSLVLKRKRSRYKEEPIDISVEEPINDQYDGYYDDVMPSDEIRRKEPVDRTLLKRIAIITMCAVAIICLAVLAMKVL